jgi:hypothetical protein
VYGWREGVGGSSDGSVDLVVACEEGGDEGAPDASVGASGG